MTLALLIASMLWIVLLPFAGFRLPYRDFDLFILVYEVVGLMLLIGMLVSAA